MHHPKNRKWATPNGLAPEFRVLHDQQWAREISAALARRSDLKRVLRQLLASWRRISRCFRAAQRERLLASSGSLLQFGMADELMREVYIHLLSTYRRFLTGCLHVVSGGSVTLSNLDDRTFDSSFSSWFPHIDTCCWSGTEMLMRRSIHRTLIRDRYACSDGVPNWQFRLSLVGDHLNITDDENRQLYEALRINIERLVHAI